MPITYSEKTAAFEGFCQIEEAEDLLSWLLDHPEGGLDLSALDHMHTAILQVIMAIQPRVDQMPKDKAWGWISALGQAGSTSCLSGAVY